MAEAQNTTRHFQDAAAELKFDESPTSQLAHVAAQATLKYSVKDYEAAAELYSQATELQAEANGEMSPENADLLYAYGRCLYHVAVKNSDVLGSRVAGETQDGPKKPTSMKLKSELPAGARDGNEIKGAEEDIASVVQEKDILVQPGDEAKPSNKPYFQFTGDENWDTSEEENQPDEGDENAEEIEEEDDFVNAYEVLDLARVLLMRKLEDAKSTAGQDEGESQETRQLRERLADTYDLQAEISLEGERFSNAVVDLRAALELKTALFDQESSILAEAHYKLSLALEFSSVTRQKDPNESLGSGMDLHVDEAMKEEAACEMEAAIASCNLRIQKEEIALCEVASVTGDTEKTKAIKSDVSDVKEMVREMKQRLVELRQTPISISNTTNSGTLDNAIPLGGILGSILGDSPAAQATRLDEASKEAKDLTDLVKRKKSADNKSPKNAGNDIDKVNGRRNVEFVEKVDEAGSRKRAKISVRNGE